MIECSYCSEDKPKNTLCLLHYYPKEYCSRFCYDATEGIVEGNCLFPDSEEDCKEKSCKRNIYNKQWNLKGL